MEDVYRIYAHTKTESYNLITKCHSERVALRLVYNLLKDNEDCVTCLVVKQTENYDYPYGLFHRDERSLVQINNRLVGIKNEMEHNKTLGRERKIGE